jgi:hypothetical protein
MTKGVEKRIEQGIIDPETAQFNGPACKGMTNVELYFSECLDG